MVEVDWISRSARKLAAKPPVAEPEIPDEFDVLQPALDDLKTNDATCDVLVRQKRAGADVACVDVVLRDRDASGFEVLAGNLPVGKRRGEFLQFAIREHRISAELKSRHLNPDRRCYL